VPSDARPSQRWLLPILQSPLVPAAQFAQQPPPTTTTLAREQGAVAKSARNRRKLEYEDPVLAMLM
jgi:hypothetical protein